MSTIAITGNTYPVKEQLKALGARWNAAAKAWMVSEDKAEQARALVNSTPQFAPNSNGSSYRPTKCRVCGIQQTRNSRGYLENKILRNGECVDCYEERKMGY